MGDSRCGPASKEDIVMAALAKHANDHFAAAEELGCCISTIKKWAFRHGIRLPRRARTPSEVIIFWNAENVAKLRSIFMRDPRPSMQQMADEMGTTRSAIQTAVSRHLMVRGAAKGASGEYSKPVNNNQMRPRDCIVCRKPFISEGRGNRQCPTCYAANSEMAA